MKTNKGEFDVWSGGQAENHLIAQREGNVEPYVSDAASKLPAEFNSGDGAWSGFYTDSIGFCSSEKELDRIGAEAPTSWDDLLDPKFQGKISMPYPATAGVGYMVLYTVLQKFGSEKPSCLAWAQSESRAIPTAASPRPTIWVLVAADLEY